MTIGQLVSSLIASGTPPELAAQVVAEAFAAGASISRPNQGDATAEKRRAYDRERKRETRGLMPPPAVWFELIASVLKRDGGKCQYCGVDGETADHVIPLTRGGTNDEGNLVATCLSCNSKKSNKFLAEWLPCPQESADKPFVSSTARTIILRETSADSTRHPQMSEKALTYKKDIKEDKKVKARKHPLSADWKPSEVHYEAAAKLSIPKSAVDAKAEDMRIWAGSTGALKLDWDLTFHGFLRRDAPKLAVRGSPTATTITPQSPSWNPWKSHYRDTGQNFSAKKMDESASNGKPWTVPSEYPPGYKSEAA